jgi:alpha-tubulin suppressor-like RCC1 family protein
MGGRSVRAPATALSSLVIAAATAGAAGGCRNATEVKVVVTTDFGCAGLRHVTVTVGNIGSQLESLPPTSTSTECTGDGYAGTIVVVPRNGTSATLGIRVIAGYQSEDAEACMPAPMSDPPSYGSGCIVARRAINYIDHTAITVPVVMHSSCSGVACPEDQTCLNGGCVPALVDPGKCLGNDCGEGSLGDGGTMADAGPGAVYVAAGTQHTCAVLGDGTVECWGYNADGELGTGTSGPNSTKPVPVMGLTGVTAIAAGTNFTCAVHDTQGAVSCWGTNNFHALGVGVNVQSSPTPVATSLTNATAVAAGAGHACALLGDRSVKCWGLNMQQQTGTGVPMGSVAVPTPVQNLNAPVIKLTAGQQHTCVIAAASGSATVPAYCWGDNTAGETGSASGATVQGTPALVQGGVSFSALAAGGNFTSGVATMTGEVYVWGDDSNGALGIGYFSPATRGSPGPVSMLPSGYVDVAAGANHLCALSGAGDVQCWGRGMNGALGDGMATDSSVPVKVVGLTGPATQVAVGAAHTCAIVAGAVECWGDNTDGQLGDGTTMQRSTPVPVPLP